MTTPILSSRGDEWQNFSDRVLKHVEYYTVPQYGDMPNDQASQFTLEEIQMNMKRYINRMTSGQRGIDEQIRDTFKLAHYACMALTLIEKESI